MDDRQLDLFASSPALEHARPIPAREVSRLAEPPQSATPKAVTPSPPRPRGKPKTPKPKIRHDHVVDVADIPPFSSEAVAFAEEALANAPPGKALFTYADIATYFSISRATVIRRQRSGLIPGVRFIGSRVLDEGHVRRLTREQVRYLLMASRT
ncbi:MAG: hypothetical protein ACOYM8_16565 [Caulobacterales bacterium]